MSATPDWDVIVVGAGHNGLTAGRPAGPRGPVHAGGRGPRDGRRMLRHRGDRARLPGLHHLLHREHAPARGDPGPGPGPRTGCGWCPASRPCRSRWTAARCWPTGTTRSAPRPGSPGTPRPTRARSGQVHAELRRLAARLQPLFMELPPDTRATGLRGLSRGGPARAAPARAARPRRRGPDPAADRQPRPVHRRRGSSPGRPRRCCWPTTCTASTAARTSRAP